MYVYGACLFYVWFSDCVGVCWNVCCVPAVVKDSGFLALECVVYLCKRCDGFCVFRLCCEAWSCRCSRIGSMSVSSCRCCMFVFGVPHVTVLNAAFCITCSLLMLVEDARGDHMKEVYSRADLMTAL